MANEDDDGCETALGADAQSLPGLRPHTEVRGRPHRALRRRVLRPVSVDVGDVVVLPGAGARGDAGGGG